MLNLLRQPYPSHDSADQQVWKAAVIGLFVGLFLLAFQPFGLNLWDTPNKTLKILGFGAVTFVITAFNFIIWRLLFPRQFSDQRWTVGREIILVMANILMIAVANRRYLEWLLNREGYFDTISWLGMVLVTFLVGLFPTTGVVLFNYVRQLRKYSQSAAALSTPVTDRGDALSAFLPTGPGQGARSATTLTLVADNEKDTLTLDPADLLYIESSDNYCTVVYRKDGKLTKPLLRSSLSRMAGQVNVPHIVRCHRSYIVNLDRVERVTGNAQGYKLHLAEGLATVPVSRQYNDTLVAELKAL